LRHALRGVTILLVAALLAVTAAPDRVAAAHAQLQRLITVTNPVRAVGTGSGRVVASEKEVPIM
jgi:hypothetical protein